jgi:hypothetical protein
MTRALAAKAARLVAAVAMTACAAGAFATGSSAEEAAASDLRVEIAAYGPALLDPETSLFATVVVDNGALVDARDISLSLSLTDAPITTREDLDAWRSGESAPDVHEVTRRPVLGTGVVDAGSTAQTTTIASPSELGLGADPWAVYGVLIRVDGAGETLKEFRTFVTFLSETPPTTPLAVVATAAGSAERVSAILTASSNARVTLLVDPTAVAKSPDAPPISAFRSVYALPEGHVDVASLARAGDTEILDAGLAASRGAAAAGDDAPWIAVVPSLDRATVNLAASRDAAAILVQPGTAPASPDADEDLAPAILEGGPGDPPIIAPEPGLSAALAGARSPSALRAADVVAESALVAKDNADGRLVVASPGTSWMLSSETHRSAALDALATLPWIRLVTLPDPLEPDADAVVDIPADAHDEDDIPLGDVSRASSRLRSLGYLADAVADPTTFLSATSSPVFSALSFENRADPTARAGTLDKALAGVQDVLDRVSLPTGSALNLISTSGNVPITVSNELDTEVTVTVVFETRSPNLIVKGRPEVTLAPGEAQQVSIPVEAISSANVNASVYLTDAEGHRLTSNTPVQVRVRADWGTAFTAIVGGAAVLLLLAGVWRTARRGRRDTRGTPGEIPEILEDDLR